MVLIIAISRYQKKKPKISSPLNNERLVSTVATIHVVYGSLLCCTYNIFHSVMYGLFCYSNFIYKHCESTFKSDESKSNS